MGRKGAASCGACLTCGASTSATCRSISWRFMPPSSRPSSSSSARRAQPQAAAACPKAVTPPRLAADHRSRCPRRPLPRAPAPPPRRAGRPAARVPAPSMPPALAPPGAQAPRARSTRHGWDPLQRPSATLPETLPTRSQRVARAAPGAARASSRQRPPEKRALTFVSHGTELCRRVGLGRRLLVIQDAPGGTRGTVQREGAPRVPQNAERCKRVCNRGRWLAPGSLRCCKSA